MKSRNCKTVIQKPKGNLLGGLEASMLQKSMDQKPRFGRLVLDLSNVNGINGPGISFLIRTMFDCQARGVRFELKEVNPGVRRVLALVGLADLFSCADRSSSVSISSKTSKPEAALFQIQEYEKCHPDLRYRPSRTLSVRRNTKGSGSRFPLSSMNHAIFLI